jgi:hypothetical protein
MNSSDKDLNYRRFLFFVAPTDLSPIRSSSKQVETKGLNFKSPEICPFCGSIVIAGNLKVNTKSLGSSFRPINVSVCKDHLKLKQTITWSYILVMILWFIPSILFIYFLLIGNPFLAIISLTIFMFCGGILLIHASIEYKIKRATIRKDIDYETRKDQAAISISNSKWADELKKLNLCHEIKQDSEEDLKPIQEFELNIRIIQTILITYSSLLLLGLIISAILSIILYGAYAIIMEFIANSIALSFGLLILIIGFNQFFLIEYRIPKRKFVIYLNAVDIPKMNSNSHIKILRSKL